MANYLSPFSSRQFLDANGIPYNGAQLFTYVAGSTTKVTTYKDEAGSSSHANPIILNTKGEPADGSGVAYPIWQIGGAAVKFVLAPSTDTDPPAAAIETWDNIDGINDTSVTIDQWTTGPTPTYVSATSLTLVGDQTSTFHVGRRIKTTNSGGTIYSTITASAYTTLTTLTIVNDSGTLDAGLSAISYGVLSASNPSVPGVKMSGANWTHTGTVTMSAKSIWTAEGADVASASDCNIWTTDGNTVHITGTTTITDWGTAPQAGATKMVIFDGAVPLTYDATTNKLNTNGANYTTVAGDRALVYAESTFSYVVTIIPLNGRSVIGALTSSAVTATTSGTSHDITGIPSWVKKITVMLTGVSIDNTTGIILQLGDSGGIETTGYKGTGVTLADATAVSASISTTYLFIAQTTIATTAQQGIGTLALSDSSTNTWTWSGIFGRDDASNVSVVSGSKSLSATLDRVRLSTVTGTANFDAGKFSLMYE